MEQYRLFEPKITYQMDWQEIAAALRAGETIRIPLFTNADRVRAYIYLALKRNGIKAHCRVWYKPQGEGYVNAREIDCFIVSPIDPVTTSPAGTGDNAIR